MISLSKIIPLFQHFLPQTHLSTSLKPNTKQLFLLLPSVAYRLEQRIYLQSVQKWKGQDKKKKKSVILYHPRDLKIGLFWLHSTGTISNFSGKSHLMTFPKGSLTCSFLIRINGGKKSFLFPFTPGFRWLFSLLVFILILSESQIFVLILRSQTDKIRKMIGRAGDVLTTLNLKICIFKWWYPGKYKHKTFKMKSCLSHNFHLSSLEC